ncbi:MAG: AAA family ATPase [Patescibacteria group bacterium]|nr:AAA family ATPase [Patescibacteria group bacterium]
MRAEVLALRANGAESNSSIAAAIGYSDAVISQYLSPDGNLYGGNTRAVEKKLREWLRDRRLEMDTSVSTISCDVAEQVANAIEDIRTAKRIGVGIGAPGIGKSRGIQLYCADHELAISFNVWAGACNKSALEDLLFEAADVARSKSGINSARVLADKLRGTSRPVIVDDAHKLTCPALQLLYDLRDQTGIPIALFGDDRLIAKLQNDGQRLRRTGIVYRLKIKDSAPLVEHHIRQLIPDAGSEMSALKKLCAVVAEKTGHFGSVQMELALAVRLKKGNPDWSWCEAVRNAHRRLIRDYELN